MNRIIIIHLLLFILCLCASGQENRANGITFDTIVHDFGILQKGSDASYNFYFVNGSNKPAVITHVKSSCGCAVTEWTREPVTPGKSGHIRVQYNTKITGTFQKTIYVYHSLNPQPTGLTIKGSVKKKPKKRKTTP